MELSFSKRHMPFVILYSVSLLALLLIEIDAVPVSIQENLRKVKYLYVLGVLFLNIINFKWRKGIKASLLVVFLFIAHCILFGFVWVNQLVAVAIDSNATQMIWYLAFILVTFWYVAENNYFKEYIVITYFVAGARLIVAGLQHREDFVNPVWGLIQSFTAEWRYKTAFGFVHPGYTSYAAFVVLALSIYYFEIYYKSEGLRKVLFWISFLLIDGVAGLELMAAAERSGIISTFFVIFAFIFIVLLRVRIERKTQYGIIVVLGITLLILIETGVFSNIWSDSNRELNITMNYPVFLRYGTMSKGLGFVDNAAFHGEIQAFPAETSSLDMYYVYIFFTTGVIGSIMIGSALLLILIKLLMNRRNSLNVISICFYLTLLFFAFWQCNMFTYRYISAYIPPVILLCSMCDDFCLEDKTIVNTTIVRKRRSLKEADS